jgi:hypothetical protein
MSTIDGTFCTDEGTDGTTSLVEEVEVNSFRKSSSETIPIGM